MKKKFRNIKVNGQEYTWAVSDYNSDGDGGHRVKIWKDKQTIYDNYTPGGNGDVTVGPAEIATIIREMHFGKEK